jgi:uncharacterized protein
VEVLTAAPRQLRKPAGVALVCHPHPLYGGALSNKVTYTLAACALKAGLHAIRFNFRGVGRSGGRHDGGRGEADDVVFLAGQVRQQMPEAQLLLAGFSFGAYVSLMAAVRLDPALVISIAPPFGEKYFAPGAEAPSAPNCPWLVVHSRDDDVVPFAETAAALDQLAPAPTLVEVDGAGHFFHGRLNLVTEHVLPFIERHWPTT